MGFGNFLFKFPVNTDVKYFQKSSKTWSYLQRKINIVRGILAKRRIKNNDYKLMIPVGD